jgi:hypothetical protein
MVNKRIESNSKKYKIIFLDDTSIIVKNLTKYSRENNLSHASVWYNMNKNRRYKDLIIQPITEEDLF